MSVAVLFVCLGNICRSPMAQGSLEQQVTEQGLSAKISVDSCGTAAFNVGKSPDPRAISAADRHGMDISQQLARQIDDEDYQTFQYIVAMDRNNLSNVIAWAPDTYRGEMKLLMDYAKNTAHAQVPDPYYAKEGEFDIVLADIAKGTANLLAYIVDAHQLSSKT